MNQTELQVALAGAKNPYQRRALQARYNGRIPLRGFANAKWNSAAGEYYGTALEDHVNGALDAQIAAAGDAEALKLAEGKLVAARNDQSGMSKLALAGLRLETANNFIIPSLKVIAAFGQIVVLQDNERPYFQNNTRQEVSVRSVGQDGAMNIVKNIKPQQEVPISLATLKTDYIEYPLRDIYNGSVVPQALANVDLARDLAANFEKTIRTSFYNSFGAFTLSGPQHLQTYAPHSFINTSNLPTTNDFTINTALLNLIGNSGGTVNSTTTGFRKEVFDVITWYTSAWGDAFGDGPVAPTGVILIPSSDVANIGVSIGLNTARLTELAASIQQNGYASINYLGRVYTLVADNTLAPGTCLVPTNRPMFTVFLKPTMDQEDVQTDALANKERRAVSKIYGYYAPIQWAVNGIRIKYRS